MQNEDNVRHEDENLPRSNALVYNPDIFTKIYILAGILFSLSALFPIIEDSGKIKLFWIADMTPGLFAITLLIVGIGIGIGALAKRLEPGVRSKLFFIPFAVLLTIANLFLGFSSGPGTGYELVFLICIYAPFLYFSYTILVSVYGLKKFRVVTCITGVFSVALIFIPTFAYHSLFEYAFDNNGKAYWLFTFSTLFLTVIYNICSCFIKFLRDHAKANVYLLSVSYVSIAVSAIMSVLPTPLSNVSDYLKLFFAAYGILILMTISLVEMCLIGKEKLSTELAQPIAEDFSE